MVAGLARRVNLLFTPASAALHRVTYHPSCVMRLSWRLTEAAAEPARRGSAPKAAAARRASEPVSPEAAAASKRAMEAAAGPVGAGAGKPAGRLDTSISLRKCFVEAGLLEDEKECFVPFNFKKKGFLMRHIPQVQSAEDSVSVGEIASELALTSRPADADEISDAESGTEDEDDEEEEPEEE